MPMGRVDDRGSFVSDTSAAAICRAKVNQLLAD